MTGCSRCETTLTGGLDTYGDAREPFCWACWWDELEDEAWLQDEGVQIWQALCMALYAEEWEARI